MACRCNERREAIISAVHGIASGDPQAVAKAAAFVARSSAEDARQGLKSLRAKAATRLALSRR